MPLPPLSTGLPLKVGEGTSKVVDTVLHNAGAVQAGKVSGYHGPGVREKKGVCGRSPQQIFVDHSLFAFRKRPILAQRLATYTQNAVKTKSKMKESWQNDREIKSTG